MYTKTHTIQWLPERWMQLAIDNRPATIYSQTKEVTGERPANMDGMPERRHTETDTIETMLQTLKG